MRHADPRRPAHLWTFTLGALALVAGGCGSSASVAEECTSNCDSTAASSDGAEPATPSSEPAAEPVTEPVTEPSEPGAEPSEPSEPADEPVAAKPTYPLMKGVNLAGAEFGYEMPGTYGVTYAYPPTSGVDHWFDAGMNVIRLPFRWERMQRQLYAEFDATELARLDELVSHITARGGYAVIDPHNYARYHGTIIGTGEVTAAAFADFWEKLAAHYKDDPRVVFAIMNEPHDMSTELWLADANAAIAAIRATGATNLIMVPGNAWTGAWSWSESWYGSANAEVMLGVKDPLDNYVFEVHQYLDPPGSGYEMATCVSTTIGSERMASFTEWLRKHNKRAFLGEIGTGDSPTCLSALDDSLTHLDENADVWLGFAYWAAGPMWGNAIGNIEPKGGKDAPQAEVLLRHL